MSITELNATIAKMTGGPANHVTEIDEYEAHILDRVCMFYDTETTGTGTNATCWQIGTVRLYRDPEKELLLFNVNEIVLPYMAADLPRNAYNAGTMHAEMQYDRDEAADHAREIMCGDYDPETFKEHMRERLHEIRVERLEGFFDEWSQWDEKIAYNLSFDKRVIESLYDEYQYEMATDDPYKCEDEQYCAYQTFKRDHPDVRPAKLPHACAHYGIAMDAAQQHTAAYDAICLMKLWINMGYASPSDQ